MSRLSRNLRLAAASITAAVLAACGSGSDEASTDGNDVPPVADAGVVNVYSARHYDSDAVMFERFTEETGIRVRVRQGDAAQLLETMKREGEASPADLVFAADAGTLWMFEDAGLLQPVDAPQIEALIPAELQDPGEEWLGLSKRLRVIVVDDELPEGAITSYRDLADPQWRGEICIRSSTNVYNLSLLADLIDRWGEEEAEAWAAGVVANMARTPQGGDTDQIKAVAAGECRIAVVNHYYWVRLLNSAAESDRNVAGATRLVFPDQDGEGTHRNITGVGYAASSANGDNAIRLIEFLASTEGQTLLVSETGELPIDAEAGRMDGLDAVSAAKVRALDLSILGQNQATARRIFDRVGWN